MMGMSDGVCVCMGYCGWLDNRGAQPVLWARARIRTS